MEEDNHDINVYIKKYSSTIENYIKKRCNDYGDVEDLTQLVYEHLTKYKIHEAQNSPWQAIKKSCNQVLVKFYKDPSIEYNAQKCPLWQQQDLFATGYSLEPLDKIEFDNDIISEDEIILRLAQIKNKYPEHLDIIEWIIYTFQSRNHPSSYMAEDKDVAYTWRIMRAAGVIEKNKDVIRKIINEVLEYE